MNSINTYNFVVLKESDDALEGFCVFNHLEKRFYCLECINPIDTTEEPKECPYCGGEVYKMDNLIDRDKAEECEWCHDCKEYNKEKHCCPRFNRVIRNTVEEIHQNRWKPMNEEPPVKSGMYICTMSEEYEEFFGGDAAPIAFRYFDSEQGSFGFWNQFSFDMLEEEPVLIWETIPVLAWMESPMPYKPGQ